MKVKLRVVSPEDKISRCQTCGSEASESKFTPLVSGNTASNVLIIRVSPSDEEVARNSLWVDQAGHRFKHLMNEFWVPVSELATTTLLHCPFDKYGVRHMRNCAPFLEQVLELKKWKYIVCMGREVMKYLCMQGAPPPSLDTLVGRFIKMREFGTTQITVLPDHYALLLQDPSEREADIMARVHMMRDGLINIAKEIKHA